MYFDFHTYFRMFRLALREPNPRRRRHVLFMVAVVIPVVASFHSACFFLDRIFYPGLRRIDVRAPVFIIGHARSGTTLLHRLMSADSERFSSFMLYELFFPSLLQKKTIRFLARCDRRLLGSRIEKRIRAWEERKFAATQDMHRMGLTVPEEDDFIFTFSCASGFWIVLLPYMGELDFYHVDRRPEQSRRRLMGFYKECVKRQLYLNGGDRIHLSKNPVFCGRVESLIETFPDARVVVLVRNPFETIPSLLKLMQRGWQLRRCGEAEIERNLRIIAEMSFHMYEAPFEVLVRHPETRHAVVDYRELVAEPKRSVERVYEQLGLPISPAFEAVLLAEQNRARSHETTHSYSLEEFGLESDAIETALGGLFERFGWRDSSPPPPAAEESR
jgi:omega-hydroxy-beta-dihydromenaquinone-9 sulfotransferase